ncbi:MAG: AMP-binding protein [Acidimicrobiales bacterium]
MPARRELPALDRRRARRPGAAHFTSGTTGSPKGALLSHGNLPASAEALRIAWRWTPRTGSILPLPLFHLHGLGVGLHGTLLAGAASCCTRRSTREARRRRGADEARHPSSSASRRWHGSSPREAPPPSSPGSSSACRTTATPSCTEPS